jgi:hypothetical protein
VSAQPNPLYAATHVQQMAGKEGNSKMAFALTTLSIALVGMMAIREFRELFRDKDTRCFDRDEAARRSR